MLEEFLPEVALAGVDRKGNPDRKQLFLDSTIVGSGEVWLEVGFGAGEHVVHLATRNPGVTVFGCETYLNGVASLLGKLHASKISNVRVHHGDIRDLLDVLPDRSIARTFVPYPDPWPKKRHHRRRFVTPEFLEPLARVMLPGSELRVSTDIPDYARQAVEQVRLNDDFEWIVNRRADWLTPWDGWRSTRYELKALEAGRIPHYLAFRRVHSQ